MFILSEKKLREVMREEIERYFGERPRNPESYEIRNNETGADIIMPNYIKEAFDEGKIKSLKDIV